jgi:hypothetical protein
VPDAVVLPVPEYEYPDWMVERSSATDWEMRALVVAVLTASTTHWDALALAVTLETTSAMDCEALALVIYPPMRRSD